MKKIIVFVMLLTLALGLNTSWAQNRDHLSIVGSSTVYPFATVVAEQFGKMTDFRTPKIESTGSGGGLKLFCEGVGVQYPDITNASRRIKKSEMEQCAKNGVTEIVEVKIGYDGIVLANSKKGQDFNLTLEEIFLALAKDVPDPKGGDRLVPNPYSTWKEINSSLPDVKIRVLGPPPTSGTRDAFVELAMEAGAEKFNTVKALDKNQFKAVAHTIREDGTYVEAGENDNLIVQKLNVDSTALGIFGFSFLDQNTDKIKGAKVSGVEPTFDDIASGAYPLSRPLFFYVKKTHVASIPGMKEYLSEFTSDRAWGLDGYLADKGMIPMGDEERSQFAEIVKNLTTLSSDQL